jgi:hypothetical protein
LGRFRTVRGWAQTVRGGWGEGTRLRTRRDGGGRSSKRLRGVMAERERERKGRRKRGRARLGRGELGRGWLYRGREGEEEPERVRERLAGLNGDGDSIPINGE